MDEIAHEVSIAANARRQRKPKAIVPVTHRSQKNSAQREPLLAVFHCPGPNDEAALRAVFEFIDHLLADGESGDKIPEQLTDPG